MQQQGQIQTLLVMIAVMEIVIYGFLRMFGGHALGVRIIRLQVRGIRAAIGYPVAWVGGFIVWLGNRIIH
jgi:hypothetical protein